MTTPEWMEHARCRGMDTRLFFPLKGEEIPHEAVRVCAQCPVAGECYEAGLVGLEHGVWAGTSWRDRKEARRTDRRRRCIRCHGIYWARGHEKYCGPECRSQSITEAYERDLAHRRQRSETTRSA